jgi:hypothetical protein
MREKFIGGDRDIGGATQKFLGPPGQAVATDYTRKYGTYG